MLAQVAALQGIAHARFAPDSADPGVVRQRGRAKLTCRERIDLLLDAGSFREVGSLAGFASYDADGAVADFTPANHVGGWGAVAGRRTIVCADDFTSRGGTRTGASGRVATSTSSRCVRCRPCAAGRLVRRRQRGLGSAEAGGRTRGPGELSAITPGGRGSGGGGSFLPGSTWARDVRQLSGVPVVNVLLGSVVGSGGQGGAGPFSVMARHRPAVRRRAAGGQPRHGYGHRRGLGDWRVHCRNGSVDSLAETEAEALAERRKFPLLPPQRLRRRVAATDDPSVRGGLFSIVPLSAPAFDMPAPSGGGRQGQLLRISVCGGRPDHRPGAVQRRRRNRGRQPPRRRRALTADGCDKLRRHVSATCSPTDHQSSGQPGFANRRRARLAL